MLWMMVRVVMMKGMGEKMKVEREGRVGGKGDKEGGEAGAGGKKWKKKR